MKYAVPGNSPDRYLIWVFGFTADHQEAIISRWLNGPTAP